MLLDYEKSETALDFERSLNVLSDERSPSSSGLRKAVNGYDNGHQMVLDHQIIKVWK